MMMAGVDAAVAGGGSGGGERAVWQIVFLCLDEFSQPPWRGCNRRKHLRFVVLSLPNKNQGRRQPDSSSKINQREEEENTHSTIYVSMLGPLAYLCSHCPVVAFFFLTKQLPNQLPAL